MNVPDLIAARAGLDPGALALVDTLTGRELSYRDVDERAARTAWRLREDLGVRAGDRVAVLSGNRVEIIEALVACGRIGALLVPLNWRLPVPELAQITADCTPSVLLADETHMAAAAELDIKAAGIADLAAGSGRVEGWGFRDGADPWYLLYTSGTTGRPKGVIQTFQMAVANHLNIGTAIGLTGADTTLNALPMFHTGGINLYTLPTLLAGGTAVVAHDFDPAMILRTLAERVTAFFGVPTMYRLLRDHPDFDRTDLSGVRSWACGGAPMPVPLLTELAGRGIAVRQGMGMTETGPTVFLVDERNALAKAGTVGRPQAFVQVRLDGGGDEGELLIRGPGITPGYWNQPETTRRSFTDDGWLRSGDIARRDADGDYTIVDRVKDMYISGGENVYPAEVEHVLHEHPRVAEAAVVGVPDDEWGEVGKAVVVTRASEEAGDVGEDGIRAFCRERLAKYKVPKHVEIVTELPRNATGKIIKARLRPVVWRVERTVEQSDFTAFAELSGDDNAIHVDPVYAATTAFGGTVAHGMFIYSLIRQAVRAHHPDAAFATTSLKFPAPTRAGERLTIDATVLDRSIDITVTRTDGTTVCEFQGELT